MHCPLGLRLSSGCGAELLQAIAAKARMKLFLWHELLGQRAERRVRALQQILHLNDLGKIGQRFDC
jgi:hypothetical protein